MNEKKKKVEEIERKIEEIVKKKGVRELQKRLMGGEIIKEEKFKEVLERVLNERSGKILLVEDTPRIADAIKDNLRGRNVVVVTTLDDAKREFDKGDFSLVITDMSFPLKSGEEETSKAGVAFIQYVKERRPDMFVIAQSSSPEYLGEAKKSGADAVFDKREVAGIEEKRQKRDELSILIISSSKNVADALKRAIETFVDNVKTVDWCKHTEADKVFSPEKYTHVIAIDGLLSDEEKLEDPEDDMELKGAITIHRLDHKDLENKVEKIIITGDPDVDEKGVFRYGRTYFPITLDLKSLMELLNKYKKESDKT